MTIKKEVLWGLGITLFIGVGIGTELQKWTDKQNESSYRSKIDKCNALMDELTEIAVTAKAKKELPASGSKLKMQLKLGGAMYDLKCDEAGDNSKCELQGQSSRP